MIRRNIWAAASGFFALILCGCSRAEVRLVSAYEDHAVRLASVFGDHMVLQQGMAARIWGTAEPGEKVTATFNNATAAASADAAGKWMLTLPAKATARYGGPFTLTVAGANRVVVSDVMVGEVWICSGQSNMDFTVARTEKKYFAGVENEAQEIAEARYPQIRVFTVDLKLADTPQSDVGGAWSVCSPETVGDFSAVAYYFGRALHLSRKVPVGLIVSTYGGSTVQAWMRRESLAATPDFQKMLAAYDQASRDWTSGEAQSRFETARAAYFKTMEQPLPAGVRPPRAPSPPREPGTDQHNPCVLYNGMVAPLVRLPARGIVWYQGESNVATADGYHDLLRAMIEDWRRLWNQPKMPFVQVQIAPNNPPDAAPRESRAALVRESQWRMGDELPAVGTAIITDYGDVKDVHPHVKRPVGDRLALLARKIAYGEKVAAESPSFASLAVEGAKVVVTFRNVGDGLVVHAVANKLAPVPGDKLMGFAVAGVDGKFVNADARIIGKDHVEVSAPSVAQPVAVRFGWANYPLVNLFGNGGLPAVPFRAEARR